MEFTILIAIICVLFSFETISYLKILKRVCELENLCNQIPCINGGDCIEEKEEISNDSV